MNNNNNFIDNLFIKKKPNYAKSKIIFFPLIVEVVLV